MILHLQLPGDVAQAREYLEKLIKQQKPIELKEIRKKRTNRQNSYLHAIIAEWACETGYTLLEMKCAIKAALGYTYDKNGCTMYRETSKMDTKELSEFTDKLRKLAADSGVDLMTPEVYEQGGWIELKKKRETMKRYL